MPRTSNWLVSFLAGIAGGLLVLWLAPQAPQAVEDIQSALPLADNRPLTAEVSKETQSHQTAVINAVKTAEPAVVSIVLTADVPVVEQFFSDPFEDFFGTSPFQIPQLRQRGTARQEIGGGSGFLISKDGLVVTNKHVVDRDGVDYSVFTSDGRQHEATVVTRDPVLDLAVMKIQGSNFPFLELADSDDIALGQTVIAIGNALAEFRNTVSVGVISGLSRSVVAGDEMGQSELLEHVIQTDAAINPGNSGGPLLNLAGQVVAVNVAVAQGSENIGFAIPANEVKPVAEAARGGKQVVRPFLGVQHILITPELAAQESLPVDHGALVVGGDTPQSLAVTPESAADRAGLVENDIILEIDGIKVDQNNSLASLIRRKQVGQTVRLKILHDGQERETSVELGEVPG